MYWGGKDILALIVLVGVIWAIGSFYWTRVISVLVLLLLWGGFAVGAPLYLIGRAFSSGAIFTGLLTGLVSFLPAAAWLVAAKAAREWFERERRWGGGFWKPWNSR